MNWWAKATFSEIYRLERKEDVRLAGFFDELPWYPDKDPLIASVFSFGFTSVRYDVNSSSKVLYSSNISRKNAAR
jgi:hypothetical protein